MKDRILTGSDVGSIAIGTDYNNIIEISNGYGDGENIIEFTATRPDNDVAKFITCFTSNGTMKIFYYDCPDEKTDYEIFEPGRYAIYLDRKMIMKFYIVKWD